LGFQAPGGVGFPGGQPAIRPDIQAWFHAVDTDRSGKISAKELQAALSNGQGKNFSEAACSLMIGTFKFVILVLFVNKWEKSLSTILNRTEGKWRRGCQLSSQSSTLPLVMRYFALKLFLFKNCKFVFASKTMYLFDSIRKMVKFVFFF